MPLVLLAAAHALAVLEVTVGLFSIYRVMNSGDDDPEQGPGCHGDVDGRVKHGSTNDHRCWERGAAACCDEQRHEEAGREGGEEEKEERSRACDYGKGTVLLREKKMV